MPCLVPIILHLSVFSAADRYWKRGGVQRMITAWVLFVPWTMCNYNILTTNSAHSPNVIHVVIREWSRKMNFWPFFNTGYKVHDNKQPATFTKKYESWTCTIQRQNQNQYQIINITNTYKLHLVHSCSGDYSKIPHWANKTSNIQIQPVVAVGILHTAHAHSGLGSSQGQILLRNATCVNVSVWSGHYCRTEGWNMPIWFAVATESMSNASHTLNTVGIMTYFAKL